MRSFRQTRFYLSSHVENIVIWLHRLLREMRVLADADSDTLLIYGTFLGSASLI